MYNYKYVRLLLPIVNIYRRGKRFSVVLEKAKTKSKQGTNEHSLYFETCLTMMQPSVADFRNYEHSLTRPVRYTASLEIVVYSQGIQVHQVHVLRHDNKHCCELDKTFQRAKSYTKEGKKLKSSLSSHNSSTVYTACCHAFLLNIQMFRVVLVLKTSKTFLASTKRASTTHQFRPS